MSINPIRNNLFRPHTTEQMEELRNSKPEYDIQEMPSREYDVENKETVSSETAWSNVTPDEEAQLAADIDVNINNEVPEFRKPQAVKPLLPNWSSQLTNNQKAEFMANINENIDNTDLPGFER